MPKMCKQKKLFGKVSGQGPEMPHRDLCIYPHSLPEEDSVVWGRGWIENITQYYNSSSDHETLVFD